MKRCSKCEIVKSETEFYFYRNGLSFSRCKPCIIEGVTARRMADPNWRAKKKKWRAANPDKIKGYKLKEVFGISFDYYAELLLKQRGACAICRRVPKLGDKKLAVDHNHRTEKTRGLLCESCNNGLGRFKECRRIILAAAKYLKKHS